MQTFCSGFLHLLLLVLPSPIFCSQAESDCSVLCFRGTMEARFVYVFVLGILFSGTKDLLRSQIITADAKLKSRGLWEIYSGLVLLVSLLFRAHNLPVLCCCLLIQALTSQFVWKKLHYDAAQITIMHYWFGQAFFYFQVQVDSTDLCGVMVSVANHLLEREAEEIKRLFRLEF